MSRELALSLLRKGNTGSEILMILDNIIPDDSESDGNEPTIESIDF
jgi:hypothetical protein